MNVPFKRDVRWPKFGGKLRHMRSSKIEGARRPRGWGDVDNPSSLVWQEGRRTACVSKSREEGAGGTDG